MHPSAHRSVGGPDLFSFNISGATYRGVPTKDPLRGYSFSSSNKEFLSLKSSSSFSKVCYSN